VKVSGTMPDATPAQLLAVIGWAVSQAVAYGWLDTRYSQLVVSAGSTILFTAWKIADAIIRNGRAKAVAANPSLANLTATAKK
jgi:hypothetical protein